MPKHTIKNMFWHGISHRTGFNDQFNQCDLKPTHPFGCVPGKQPARRILIQCAHVFILPTACRAADKLRRCRQLRFCAADRQGLRSDRSGSRDRQQQRSYPEHNRHVRQHARDGGAACHHAPSLQIGRHHPCDWYHRRAARHANTPAMRHLPVSRLRCNRRTVSTRQSLYI